MGVVFLSVLISGIVFGFIGSFIAKNKGISERTGFLFGFFLGPIGLIIVALLNAPNSTRVPASARYDGSRDLSDERYQLWLTQKYDITRNDTLGRYVVGRNSFGALEEALAHAHRLQGAQHERQQAENEHAVLVRKRLMYVLAACVFAAVLLFAGNFVVDYIDRRKAIAAADNAVAARREELANALANVNLPLIPSAQMTASDYQNDFSTEQLKELEFLTSEVGQPLGQAGDSCSVAIGKVNMTDFGGTEVFFYSSDTPEKVRSFYVASLQEAGFSKASQFQGEYEGRIEYANKNHVVFVKSGFLEGSTFVKICVLRRSKMDKVFEMKKNHDLQMENYKAESEASERNLKRRLRALGVS